jgi:formylglycine-generating enzyme required for sulfatase activity
VSDLCNHANFGDSASPYYAGLAAPCAENPSPALGTAPVGSYQPNAWGLYDMVGNTFKFIEDCLFPNYKGAPKNGAPRVAGRCKAGFVTRGYFFDSIYADMRSAARCLAGEQPTERGNYLSLRVAVSLDKNAWDQ